jgi:uncharacterized membrane protein
MNVAILLSPCLLSWCAHRQIRLLKRCCLLLRLYGIDGLWSIGTLMTDTGILKYSENNLFQCHFIHHKSHRTVVVYKFSSGGSVISSSFLPGVLLVYFSSPFSSPFKTSIKYCTYLLKTSLFGINFQLLCHYIMMFGLKLFLTPFIFL